MNEIVLDASVVLAILFNEPGIENLPESALDTALISTVNLAEVQGKLVHLGRTPEEAWQDICVLGIQAQIYDEQQAREAGSLITQTQSLGLSLGDRSCLALAIALQAPVYTTEKIWRGLELGIPIHVLR